MSVEITTQPQAQVTGHEEDDDRVFYFCCFGNFSGNTETSEHWEALHLNRNSWDQVFEVLNPRSAIVISLPGIEDIRINLRFRSLQDFSEKQIVAQVPLLASLRTLSDKVASANRDQPISIPSLLAEHPELAMVKQLAESGSGGEVVDLLSMIDIGEEKDEPNLPRLKSLFGADSFDGDQRGKVVAEIDQVMGMVLDQIRDDEDLNALHGRWRALKQFLTFKHIHLSLVDCVKEDLCDATFTLLLKPPQGNPQPVDLVFYCDEIADNDPDRHALYHLGRMAESLSAPFILNTARTVFGCKSWRHLSHLRDISGRIASPERVKWRKQREESGSRWLFMAVNPIMVKPGDEAGDHDAAAPTAPPSTYLALLTASLLVDGKWPGEMLHPGHQLDFSSQCRATLDEQQGYDLAFEGYCGVSGREGGDRLYLLGMFDFSRVKQPANQQLEAANLVEHTLACRFYSGACSRYLIANEGKPSFREDFMKYAAIKEESDLQFEESEGQRIYRLKPSYTVLGVQPDVVIALG